MKAIPTLMEHSSEGDSASGPEGSGSEGSGAEGAGDSAGESAGTEASGAEGGESNADSGGAPSEAAAPESAPAADAAPAAEAAPTAPSAPAAGSAPAASAGPESGPATEPSPVPTAPAPVVAPPPPALVVAPPPVASVPVEAPPDNPPRANDDSVNILESETVDLSTLLLGNDLDPDGQILTLTSVDTSNTQGDVEFDQITESLSYTPNQETLDAGETKTDTFTYTIASGNFTDTATVTLTITGENDVPVAVNDIFTATEDEVLSVSIAEGLLSNDTDINTNDVLTVINAVPVTGDDTPIDIREAGSFDFAASSSVALNALDDGETFTSVYSYTIEDSNAGSATGTLSIVVSGINDAPILVDDTGQSAEAGIITLSPLLNDTDAEGQALNIVALEVPGNGSAAISSDGQTIEYVAPNDLSEGEVRQEEIIYTVSDGKLSSQATILVEVTGQNDAPIIQAPTPTAVPPLMAASGPVQLDVLSSISDDSAELTVTELDASETLGNVFLGSVFYDPLDAFVYLNEGETATDSFGFTVADAEGLTSDGQFIVTITGEADAPVADSPISASFSEDDAANLLDLTLGVTDPDEIDSLTIADFSVTGSSAGLVLLGNEVSVDPSAYNALEAGSTSISVLNYDAVDSTGLSVSHSATITFTGVNDLPTSLDATVTAAEDTPFVFALTDFGFADVDTLDQLQGITVTRPSSIGTLALNGDAVVSGQSISHEDIVAGALTFSPLANENGVGYDSFDFTVNDGLADSLNQATLTIDVTAVDDLPTAADTTVTLTEDTQFVFAVADFGFADVDAMDQLQSITITSLASVGKLELNGAGVTANQAISQSDISAGALTFTPFEDGNGVGYDSFNFTVNDGVADSLVPSTLTIGVTAVNDLPKATDNTVTATEDTAFVFAAANFGFTDVDTADQLQSITVTTLASTARLH